MVSKMSELKMAALGDIHLGHNRTLTDEIVLSLMSVFPDNEITADLDIIWFTGDVLDRLLSVPDEPYYLVRKWIEQFLRLMVRLDIVVRIVEGTRSHDWKQSREFILINEMAGIGADVRYVDTLSIEYIERFGISVMYLPDEYSPTTEETWAKVMHLLNTEKLTMVDYIVMHGCFPHQMPSHLFNPLMMHDPEKYLSITRKYIFVGHIHFWSQYKRILAAGSLDRLGHGEEAPKGHLRLVVRENGDDTITFIENKRAKIYKTIDCHGLGDEQLLKVVKEKVKDLPPNSYIRLKSGKMDVAVGAAAYFKANYPKYVWVTEIETEKNSEKINREILKPIIPSLRLTRETIQRLLLERIQVKYPDQLAACQRILEEVVDG